MHQYYPIAPYQDQQQLSESSDTTAALSTSTTPTGKRMGPLSFTANSKVDPTKHRSRSQSIGGPPIDEADYADEVVIDYDAIRKSIVEAINYSMNSGIIFRYSRREQIYIHTYIHTYIHAAYTQRSDAW
jgi:hypothetical protein